MNTLRGVGQGTTPVYGRAALVNDETGRPTLNADLLVVAARNARRSDETLNIILVASDPIQALLMPLPQGLTLSGVVAETDADRPLPLNSPPMVSGITEARSAIAEGCLLIVDPARGRVIVEPDAREVARLQTDAFRSRVLLGAEHVPAVTQSGREVAVWASVRYFSEAEGAIDEGADGLYVEPFGDILEETEGDAALANLRRLAELTGGGSVTLATSIEMLDPAAVVRAAAQCQLALLVSMENLPLPLADLRAEFNAIVAEQRDAEREAVRPQFYARLSDLDAPENAAFDALLIDETVLAALTLETVLAALTLETVLSLPPLYLSATESRDALSSAITLGVAGVIVTPDAVAATKDQIRAQE